jgi:hypothetical protein
VRLANAIVALGLATACGIAWPDGSVPPEPVVGVNVIENQIKVAPILQPTPYFIPDRACKRHSKSGTRACLRVSKAS